PSTAAAAATNAELEGLDPTLIELMVKELSENLESLDEWVEHNRDADRPQAIDDRLVRAVHTMKGTMRLVPIGSENDTAQVLEQYLEELAHSGDAPDDAGLEAILACQDLFHKRLSRLQGEAVDDEEFDSGDLSAELRRLHGLAYRDRAEVDAPTPAEDEPLLSSDADVTGPEYADSGFFGLDEEAQAEADETVEAGAAESEEVDGDDAFEFIDMDAEAEEPPAQIEEFDEAEEDIAGADETEAAEEFEEEAEAEAEADEATEE